jgi:PAS domain S-box-containing protein
MSEKSDIIISEKEKKLLAENEELRTKLAEAEDILEAIRTGAIDAITASGPNGPQIFTLQSADFSYRMLIEEMNEGALILNNNGIILYSNSKFADLLELDLEKVIGAEFYNFISSSDRNRFKNLFEQGWKKSMKGEFEIHGAKKVLPFSLSMYPLNANDPPVLGLIASDLSAEREIRDVKSEVVKKNLIITEKEKELIKERQTKEEAERFRIVLEGIPQIAWTSTPQGKINYTNQFWHNYTGFSFEETKNDGWLNALHPDDKQRTIDYFTHALKSGEKMHMEARFKRSKDHAFRWHLIDALPIINSEGRITLWVGTCTDINDQKEVAETIRSKNAELLRINNDLDNFIYTASHDLKAPVSNIEGLINALYSIIEDQGIKNDDINGVMEMMMKSVFRFKTTVEDLTEITKTQKDLGQDVEAVNCKQIIIDVIESIKQNIEKAHANIIIEADDSTQIKFSRKNLHSIIYNLLSNSIKYRSPKRKPEILIKTDKIKGYIILSVKDNGLGIKEADKSKVFSMFKRMHDHVEGTGIGLYIVKRIIDNAGGKIELESEENKGTSFKVYLPQK